MAAHVDGDDAVAVCECGGLVADRPARLPRGGHQLKRAAGAALRVHDPVAMDNFREIHPELTYCDGPYQAAEGADLDAGLEPGT